MKWALLGGKRIEASPGVIANCPTCQQPVRAKCGKIISWHWAHISKDCDPWSEPESEWHRQWKNLFPLEMQEVAIGNHRADILTKRGVIEFQHSSITPDEIKEREIFYQKMVWVIDARTFTFEKASDVYVARYRKKNPKSDDLFSLLDDNERARFELFLKQEDLINPCWYWKWPSRSWEDAIKTIVFDVGTDELLLVKDIQWWPAPCRFYFSRITKKRFIESCVGNV